MLPNDLELGQALFRKPRDIVREGFGGTLPTVQVDAEAVTDSEDGYFLAMVDADLFAADDLVQDADIDTPDGYALLEVPTSVSVTAGDSVLLTVQGNKPTDAGNIGWGDKTVLRIVQTESDITYNFDTFNTYVNSNDDAVESLSEQVAANADGVEANAQAIADEVLTRSSFIRFSTDEQALPQMEMGAEGYPKAMRLTTTALEFTDGDERVASIEDGSLDIQNAQVHQTLQFGNFAFIPRSNNNLALKWIGDSI